jgi:hypothetical protein
MFLQECMIRSRNVTRKTHSVGSIILKMPTLRSLIAAPILSGVVDFDVPEGAHYIGRLGLGVAAGLLHRSGAHGPYFVLLTFLLVSVLRILYSLMGAAISFWSYLRLCPLGRVQSTPPALRAGGGGRGILHLWAQCIAGPV